MSKSRTLKSRARPKKRTGRLIACIAPLAAIAICVAVVLPTSPVDAAQAPVPLGAATSFAVLAAAGITNTGATTIAGDIGSFPTPSETGLGTVTQNGADHAGDAVTQQAKNDLTTAYTTAANALPVNNVPTELGNTTLTPGIYRSGTLGITGALTLNTLGDPNAVFIFQAGSTLITASGSSVVVIGSTTACNVFWQIGSSATLGTGSHILGTVMAADAITATTGATIQGRLLAETASVTLNNNTITRSVCAASTPTTTTTTTANGPGSTAASTTTAPGTTPTTAAPVAAPAPGAGTGTGTPGTPGSPAAPGTPGTPGAPGTPAPPLPETL